MIVFVDSKWGPRQYGGEAVCTKLQLSLYSITNLFFTVCQIQVFVPRDGATDEDDGYLMTFVFDESTHSSELRLLDSRELVELARVPLPQRVPYGFHGTWMTPQQIADQRV